jgi:hypothetical protein
MEEKLEIASCCASCKYFIDSSPYDICQMGDTRYKTYPFYLCPFYDQNEHLEHTKAYLDQQSEK